MKTLEVDCDFYVNDMANLDCPIENIIEIFKDHPSIVSINQNGFTSNNLSFKFVSENDVYRVINNIHSPKSYQKNNIPPKVLKENADAYTSVLCDDINHNIVKGKFPVNQAGITPLFKNLNVF